MKRGQIFTVDLMIALAVIVLGIGLLVNAWSWQLEQSRSSMEYAKMQQIAIDAAALDYYNGDYLGLDKNPSFYPSGAEWFGYNLSQTPMAGYSCIGSQRGTGDSPNTGVAYVCRKE